MKITPFVIYLVAALGVPASASADRYLYKTTAEIVTEPGAILFATVTSIAPTPGVSTHATVTLHNCTAVAGTCPTDGLPIDVPLTSLTGGVQLSRFGEPLTVGGRYLVLLASEGATAGPGYDGSPNLFEVDATTGLVICAGGFVFGLGNHGLWCSTQDQQFGLPMTEDELATLLVSERLQAVANSMPAGLQACYQLNGCSGPAPDIDDSTRPTPP